MSSCIPWLCLVLTFLVHPIHAAEVDPAELQIAKPQNLRSSAKYELPNIHSYIHLTETNKLTGPKRLQAIAQSMRDAVKQKQVEDNEVSPADLGMNFAVSAFLPTTDENKNHVIMSVSQPRGQIRKDMTDAFLAPDTFLNKLHQSRGGGKVEKERTNDAEQALLYHADDKLDDSYFLKEDSKRAKFNYGAFAEIAGPDHGDKTEGRVPADKSSTIQYPCAGCDPQLTRANIGHIPNTKGVSLDEKSRLERKARDNGDLLMRMHNQARQQESRSGHEPFQVEASPENAGKGTKHQLSQEAAGGAARAETGRLPDSLQNPHQAERIVENARPGEKHRLSQEEAEGAARAAAGPAAVLDSSDSNSQKEDYLSSAYYREWLEMLPSNQEAIPQWEAARKAAGLAPVFDQSTSSSSSDKSDAAATSKDCDTTLSKRDTSLHRRVAACASQLSQLKLKQEPKTRNTDIAQSVSTNTQALDRSQMRQQTSSKQLASSFTNRQHASKQGLKHRSKKQSIRNQLTTKQFRKNPANKYAYQKSTNQKPAFKQFANIGPTKKQAVNQLPNKQLLRPSLSKWPARTLPSSHFAKNQFVKQSEGKQLARQPLIKQPAEQLWNRKLPYRPFNSKQPSRQLRNQQQLNKMIGHQPTKQSADVRPTKLLVKQRPASKQLMNKQVAGKQPAKQPIKTQQANRQPVKELANKQPANERPLNKQPVNRQPVNKQPVNKQPVNRQPVNRQPVNRQPVNRQPVNRQPVNKQPVNKQPTNKKPVNKQPTNKQPVDKAGKKAGFPHK